MVVLDDLLDGGTFLVVEDDADYTEEDGLEYLQDNVQWLSELVDPVSHEDRCELHPPGCLSFLQLVSSLQLVHHIHPLLHNLVLLILEARHQIAHSLLKLHLDLFLSVILFLLDVRKHDSFFVHQLHVVICRVGVLWDWQVDVREIFDRFRGLAIVDDVTVDH